MVGQSYLLPTIKRRAVGYGPRTFESRPSGFGAWTTATFNGGMNEEIISQCHTGIWPPPLKSDKDVGGPMQLHRTWDQYTVTANVDWALTRGEIGFAQLIGYALGTSPAVVGSGSAINAFGTSAIAAVLPTNPNASLAAAIGELKRDGLPRLPGSSMRDQVDAARRSGDEYLNVEFGWLPLVNDLREFAHSLRNARQLIDQYTRDSNKKIRRRFVLQPITSTSVFTGTGRAYGQNILASGCTVSRRDETKFWFSGAFKYHIPIDSGFMNRLIRYEALSNYLFGTRITPEVIWELAPWSWAVDWFSNMGDVIHNISLLGSDGLVMQYGYAMRHARVEEVLRGTFPRTSGGGTPASVFLERTIGSEWKQRIRANPYGFGIDDTDLSARQLAILAALGLTRGSRTQ
jgi:hypothetical protein